MTDETNVLDQYRAMRDGLPDSIAEQYRVLNANPVAKQRPAFLDFLEGLARANGAGDEALMIVLTVLDKYEEPGVPDTAASYVAILDEVAEKSVAHARLGGT
jgi:hypothetical protein